MKWQLVKTLYKVRSPVTEQQRLWKEGIVWKQVSCPYILKFNGVFYYNDVPAIVTPWMRPMETSPNIWRNTTMRIGYVW